MDPASDVHVCNSSIAYRFTRTHPYNGDTILSGLSTAKIECYGTIKITIQSDSGSSVINLINVAYVPDFLTNLVAYTKLEAKGVYINGRNRRLERNSETFCLLKKHGGHSLLEDNTATKSVATEDSSQGSFAASASSSVVTRTVTEWHGILGHASADAIKHLATSAEGVSVKQDGVPVPKTNKCEPCALSKAHNIVSRSSAKSEPSTRPFQRITFDLMQFDTAYNGDKWASHVACDFTDFNMVWTHASKTEAPQILLNAITMIDTRYGFKVSYIRTDGEKALNNSFKAELAAKGVTFEPSSPDTQAQNGYSERKGGILTTKARIMRLARRLPANLWPELMRVAGYVTNKTPMRKHQWKTPVKLVMGYLPSITYFRLIRYKAYVLNKYVPRK